MRVLFDQATPVPIRPFLTGHAASTAAYAAVNTATPGSYVEVEIP